MQTINLKQYYPFCTEDTFVEVSDEIVEAFLLDKRAEAARERKMYRYKAFYSLDCDDGIVKILNALNISADELLCDLVPSASHVTDDEISKRLEGLTPMQKKVALDLLDTYITNLPYLTKEE